MPHDRQLVGHSDADVLLHAVTDALLGAAALPDIGRMFPNTDPAHRGRDSADMLRAAAAKVAEAGYGIVNIDCVVHAERPKLADYLDAIRHRIAGILQLNPHQIGLKAKTGEGAGPIGREEIIEARCVAFWRFPAMRSIAVSGLRAVGSRLMIRCRETAISLIRISIDNQKS